MSLVTIIVLTYEQPSFFFEALDSVLKQDVSEFNLIIIDDCSRRDPFNVEYVENYISRNCQTNLSQLVIKKNKQNLGTVKCLNIALELIKTPYYFVVAGDDILPNKAISLLLDFACKSSYDCIGGKINSFSNFEIKDFVDWTSHLSVKKIERLNLIEGTQRFREVMMRNLESPSLVGSILKTKTIRNIGGYDENFVLYEDTPLLMKLLLNDAKFGFIDEVIYFYRIGEGITSSAHNSGSLVLMRDYITLYECLDHDQLLSKALNTKKMIIKHKIKYQYLSKDSISLKFIFILINLPSIFRYFLLDKVVTIFKQ